MSEEIVCKICGTKMEKRKAIIDLYPASSATVKTDQDVDEIWKCPKCGSVLRW